MIGPERNAETLRLYFAEKWRVGTIAKQLGVQHGTVKWVTDTSGVGQAVRIKRGSMAEPYIPLIVETLEKYPKLTADTPALTHRQRSAQALLVD